MSFLPTHLPHQPKEAEEDYGQFFLHRLVRAAPSALFHGLPHHPAPTHPPQKPQTWHRSRVPQLGTLLWSRHLTLPCPSCHHCFSGSKFPFPR